MHALSREDHMKYSALCIMCKDDPIAIQENIKYHLLLGFDHIFVYDNKSEVSLSNQLKSFKQVTVFDWEDCRQGSQVRCYSSFLADHSKNFLWVGFIDTDEFIVLNEACNIGEFLQGYEEFGGVGINWKCFGSSGHLKTQPSIISSYIHAPKTNLANIHIKSIVNTARVTGVVTPHSFKYIDKFFCVNELKMQIYGPFNDPPTYKHAQLNHYITRSHEDFETKLKRGGGNNKLKKKMHVLCRTWNSFQNGEEDKAIFECLKRIEIDCGEKLI